MRLYVLGAPCAGKSTLAGPLRVVVGCPVLDMDDELLRANGGAWPPLDVKRALTDQVIADASRLMDVVLMHSHLDDEQLARLRSDGWEVGLLDLPEEVMRERAAQRLARDGWTNVEWLPIHLAEISHLREQGAFDHVVDATAPPQEVVRAVAELVTGPGSSCQSGSGSP